LHSLRTHHKKMHAKTDSEVTSLAPSSPTRSPRRPVYYVQSPSRDSHDGEKTTTSFHSTPVLSPMGSPPHSHSSVGRHSRESSSSRFSGSLKPGSRKISPNDASRGGRKEQKQWKECDVIEEEGLLDDEERRKGLPRKCYFLAFVLGFFILFSFFSLILWGASKQQKPKITMKVYYILIYSHENYYNWGNWLALIGLFSCRVLHLSNLESKLVLIQQEWQLIWSLWTPQWEWPIATKEHFSESMWPQHLWIYPTLKSL